MSACTHQIIHAKKKINLQTIEVPGQYTGLRKPDPESHLQIISCGDTVLTMSSMRKPKRLTIRTSDEKEQRWLVKGGEDLRMDQRIEQMFGVVNQILTNAAQCVKRKLVIRTYDVIPLTRSVGILEWVPNTIPIKSLINEQIAKQQKKKGQNPFTISLSCWYLCFSLFFFGFFCGFQGSKKYLKKRGRGA